MFRQRFGTGELRTAFDIYRVQSADGAQDRFEPRAGELPHTHEELAVLVEHAGLSAMDAIVAGTRNGADALGLGDTRGTLQVGKRADLLVLEVDPLADIRSTTRLRMTLLGGRIVPVATP